MGFWVKEPLKKLMSFCKPFGGGRDMLTFGAASEDLNEPESYE